METSQILQFSGEIHSFAQDLIDTWFRYQWCRLLVLNLGKYNWRGYGHLSLPFGQDVEG